jgi:large subunit ribosomal protein L6
MSRIGKKPVPVPKAVTAKVEGQKVTVKGPKGELSLTIVDDVIVELTGEGVKVAPREDTKRARAMWGMSRSLIDNLIAGVNTGFSKTLEITGVGYRVALKNPKELQLQLGYSHEIIYAVPEGITIQAPKPTEVIVSGIDKQKVGQVCAEIRRYRPPEPYKGKGVKYAGEFIFRKEGKKK